MRKILLIEDAPDAQVLVRMALDRHYDVKSAGTIADGERALRAGDVDLLLLDVGLPDGNGFEFLSRLREEPMHRTLPVIFITVSNDVNDKVRGFSSGGDDYLTKPFEPLELRARVEAKLRKLDESIADSGRLRIGLLVLDVFFHKAYVLDVKRPVEPSAGTPDLGLTAKEFELLHLFARNPGKTIERVAILNTIWPGADSEGSRTLDRHLSTLRKKMPTTAGSIESVHRVGYRFKTS